MSNARRKWLIALSIVLALIFLTGYIVVRTWLDPLIKEALVTGVAKSSNGLYSLQVKRLKIHLLAGSAELDGIQLSTDSLRWEALRPENSGKMPLQLGLQIKRIRIKNFSIIQYWRTGHLFLDKVNIMDPQVKVSSIQDSIPVKNPDTDSLTTGLLDRLPQLISPFAKSIHIKTATVTNGSLIYRHLLEQKLSYHQADSIGLALTGIRIIANEPTEASRALYADHISLQFRNYELYPSGDLYGYRIQSAKLNEEKDLVQLQGISILPKVPDAEFMQKLTRRIPLLKIRMDEIKIHKFDLFRAFHKKAWSMETIVVETARIEVYQNKNLPAKLPKRMPHELFRAIRADLDIDTILVRNSNILYTLRDKNQEGQLEFEHLNGVLLNITNDPLQMSDSSPAMIHVRSELMGAGLLDITLQIPLLSDDFRCDYSAHLGNIDMTYLNRMITDQNKFRVESGNSESIILNLQVRNGLARGKIEATYNNLKISVLEAEDGHKRKLISVVANILLRNNNGHGPMNRPFKVGTVYYRRQSADGILRYLWRAAQTGLMETLVPKGMTVKMQE